METHIQRYTKEKEWFSGEKGAQCFAACQGLEQKTFFLLDYLLALRPGKVTPAEQTILFRLAFFLAGAVGASAEPYAQGAAFLDPGKNPFLAFARSAPSLEDEPVYVSLLAILHGVADPFMTNDWIYGLHTLSREALNEQLETVGHPFLPISSLLADPAAFVIEEEKQNLQLAVIWLFGKNGIER